MGRLKQFLPLGDSTVIHHCLDAITASGIVDISVVLGTWHKELRKAISDYPVNIVVNEVAGSDMAESVRIGLPGTDARSTGVVICLSDHPLVSPETLRTLAVTHSEEPRMIIIPVYNGRRGHPALFPKDVIQEIFFGLNLREIIRNEPRRVKIIEVSDEGVILDMDTREDYLAIMKKKGAVRNVEGS